MKKVKIPSIKVPPIKKHIEKNQKHFAVVGAVLLVTLFLLITALIVDSQRPKMYHLPDPKKAQTKEQQKVLAAQQSELQVINKEVRLPTDEQPIFATVAQKEQLQKQNFFKKAQNGDRVLLYPKHKKVILYRPATKKVIAVSRLQYDDKASITPTNVPITPTLHPIEADIHTQ